LEGTKSQTRDNPIPWIPGIGTISKMFDSDLQRVIICFLHKERVQQAEVDERFAVQSCKALYSKQSIES
jgi:hypothetical protein